MKNCHLRVRNLIRFLPALFFVLLFQATQAETGTEPSGNSHHETQRNVIIDFRSEESVKSFYTNPEFDKLSEIVTREGARLTLGSIVGQGHSAVVFCTAPNGGQVIKIAKEEKYFPVFLQEIEDAQKISEAGIPIAEITNREFKDPTAYLIKTRIAGPTAAELRTNNSYTDPMIENLASLFALAFEKEIHLDAYDTANFIWNSRQESFVIVDTKLRTFPNRLNIVSLSEWKNNFFSRQSEKDKFLHFLEEIKGVEFIDQAELALKQAASMNHALCHDIFLNSGL